MRCVARLIVVAGTAFLLSVGGASASALPRADDGHGAATPVPTAATHDHGSVPQPSAGSHDEHGTAPTPGLHDEHGTTVASTGPGSETRLLVLSLFAGVNGLVLMVASVQRGRAAGARDRRRTARAAAPPAV